MADIVELATDINSNWEFKNGDLEIISGSDNLIQATRNRLLTTLDTLEDFYDEYGSVLRNFLGWKKDDITLKFMKIEVESTLEQDPRYADFDLELKYTSKGVDIMIVVYFDDDTTLELDYIFSDDGTLIEA